MFPPRFLVLILLTICLLGACITGNNGPSPPPQQPRSAKEENLAMGNPSSASASNPDNYLLAKTQYALSYNSTKGIANWVSWHLSPAWKGYEARCNCFSPDDALPQGYKIAVSNLYSNSGYDRGHLCPSDDRDCNPDDNAATFAMSNIAPQAINLNRDVWQKLEYYCRKLLSQGNELYIIAGSYGEKSKLGNQITIPSNFWKVIVVLKEDTNDLARINSNTRLIAVDIPNEENVNQYYWSHYRTTVNSIEKISGYDLLSALPVDIQRGLESRVDTGPVR